MNYINNALLSAREVVIAKIFKKTGYDEPKTLVYIYFILVSVPDKKTLNLTMSVNSIVLVSYMDAHD